MEEPTEREHLDVYVSQLHTQHNQQDEVFESAVVALPSAELSLLLEALPIEDRQGRWQQVPDDEKATVLVGMRAQAREPIIASLSPEQVDLLLQQLDAESLIELSINLSDELIDRAYHHLNEKQKVWYKDSSQFEVDQIGRFTDHNIVARPQNTTVKEALRAVKRSSLSEVHQVYVLDKDGKFIGIVRISSILKATDENQLRNLRLSPVF